LRFVFLSPGHFGATLRAWGYPTAMPNKGYQIGNPVPVDQEFFGDSSLFDALGAVLRRGFCAMARPMRGAVFFIDGHRQSPGALTSRFLLPNRGTFVTLGPETCRGMVD
jgi:hypothetical protein